MLGRWNQVDKFDGKGNFNVWKCVAIDVLVQQWLIDALERIKSESTTAEEWKVMEWKAASTIRLYLSDEVKYSVIKENSSKKLWKRLEDLYMAKSLTNR
uniref:Retrotransposon Copia-like N-terminal domain-containing protein n=1 Tax=Setaria italica TaxID=4555 RepID=K3XRT5_SETIT